MSDWSKIVAMRERELQRRLKEDPMFEAAYMEASEASYQDYADRQAERDRVKAQHAGELDEWGREIEL